MNEMQPIVFVVDDDKLFRRSTERLDRSAGLNVQSLISANDLLKNPRPEVPACFIPGVGMPGWKGMDLQCEPAQLGINILILAMATGGEMQQRGTLTGGRET